MVELFGERYLMAGLITMGQIAFLAAPTMFSYVAAKSPVGGKRSIGASFAKAAVIGLVSSLFLILLICI